MKKVLFLARHSLENQYLAHRLHAEGLIHAIVVETGERAKQRKLKRYFRNLFRIPLSVLDIASLLLYSRLYSPPTNNFVKQQNLPEGWPLEPIGTVVDANDEECIEVLKKFSPDLLLVCGTALLKKPVLETPNDFALNVHGGVTPKYRNVHSDFWVFYHRDYENLGVSLLRMTTGIDSGPLIAQARVSSGTYTELGEAKVELLKTTVNVVSETLSKYQQEELSGESQDTSKSGFFPSPGILAIFQFFLKGRQNKKEK